MQFHVAEKLSGVSAMNNKAYQLFEHYRQNLNLVRADPRVQLEPERDDMVICPLCFESWFTVEAIESKLLTLEHVPPRSLKGKPIILTCQECNNTQGSTLDSSLAGYICDIDVLNGQGTGYVDGKLKLDNGDEIRINFRTTEKGWRIVPVPKASREQHMQSVNDSFENGKVEKLNVTLQITNPRRAKLSLLRAAYLLAVAHMGYGFLMNLNLGIIRYQLQHPKEDVFPIQAVQMLTKQQMPDNILGTNVIHLSETLKSYFIVFDVQLKGSVPHRVGVHLPGPNSRDYGFFDFLKSIENEKLSFRLNHYSISFEDKLKYPFLAHSIWNDN